MGSISSLDAVRAIQERLQNDGIDVNTGRDDLLSEEESFWRYHYTLLKERGYTLRRRYQPDWSPSWNLHPNKPQGIFEDGHAPRNPGVLDATRSDGKLVFLKRLSFPDCKDELIIGNRLSSEPFLSHPDNHCVPIFEVLQVPEDPNTSILILPFLRPFNVPWFETVGEVVEFFNQIFRGLKLMHDNSIAHRDVKVDNIMADTLQLYNPIPHPVISSKSHDFRGVPRVVSSRTRRPVKYYLIDFGLSKAYRSEDAPFREISGWGGDRSAPEFQTPEPTLCDPFPVDVYCMANCIRGVFLDGNKFHTPKKGLEFMRVLVQDMVKDDPKQRPTMAEVVSRFEEITSNLSKWKLRSRVADVNEPIILGWFRSVRHWIKQATYVIRRIPAIPKP